MVGKHIQSDHQWSCFIELKFFSFNTRIFFFFSELKSKVFKYSTIPRNPSNMLVNLADCHVHMSKIVLLSPRYRFIIAICMPAQGDLSHSFEDSIHNMRVNLILAKQVYRSH